MSLAFLRLLVLLGRKSCCNAFQRCMRKNHGRGASVVRSEATIPFGTATAAQFSELLPGIGAGSAASTSSIDVLPSLLSVAAISAHAASFQTVIDTVLAQSFPYPLLGSVHTSSDISLPDAQAVFQHWASSAAVDVGLSLEAGLARATATWQAADDAPHRRGTEATVRVQLTTSAADPAGAGTLWTSDTRMLFFHAGRGKASSSASSSGSAPVPAVVPALPSAATSPFAETVHLPRELPNQWAHLSGDCNPIHMHWLGAWAFGFRSGRRAVAHGMSVVLLCLPAAMRRLLDGSEIPAALSGAVGVPGAGTVAAAPGQRRRISLRLRVSFVRPAFVPGSMSVHLGAVEKSADEAPERGAERMPLAAASSLDAAEQSSAPAGLRRRHAAEAQQAASLAGGKTAVERAALEPAQAASEARDTSLPGDTPPRTRLCTRYTLSFQLAQRASGGAPSSKRAASSARQSSAVASAAAAAAPTPEPQAHPSAVAGEKVCIVGELSLLVQAPIAKPQPTSTSAPSL